MLFVLSKLAPELGFELEAASVDHGLRSSAANDVAIAAQQAAALGVPFHALKVQVERRSSLQAQARTARYAALGRLAAERGAVRIAVGHTRDDQAETVLLRMIRGTGLHGLGAIDPNRADGVIRPLIDCERADVHRLARAEFRELADDPSNADQRFERVRIRVHVMPLLVAANPQLARHLCALADEAREMRAPLGEAVRAVLDQAGAHTEPGTLRIEALASRPVRLRRAAFRAWLKERGATPVSRSHVDELDHALTIRRGHVWLASGFFARIEGDRLVLRSSSAQGQAGEP
jgi:tRNA(Ile)-lysidine synthase